MRRQRLGDSMVQEEALLAEQTRLLYASLPAAIVINALLALMLGVVQASVIAQDKLLLSGLLIGSVLSVRTLLLLAWQRGGQDAKNPSWHWMRRFRITAIATGIAWGAGTVMLFPAGDVPHQAFLAFVLAGLSSGAITSLGVDRISTRGFIVPTLLPLIVCFWTEGGAMPLAMGTMGLLYMFAIVANAARVGASFNEIIQLRIEAVNRERVLGQSEERLRQAQQVAHLGSSVWSAQSGKLLWSDEYFRIWGMEPQSVTPSHALFRKGIHPDDLDKVESILQHAMLKGQPYDFEHRVMWPDGTVRHVHSCGEVIFDDAGKVVRMTGTAQDVTARREAEINWQEALERLQKIASRVPGVVYQFRMRPDGSFCFPFASDAIYEIFRVSPEQVREDAEPVFALVLPEDLPATLESIMVSARDLSPWHHEARIRFDDDKVRWLFGNALPQREADGSVLWHGFVTDITERKQIEESLRQLNEQLEQKVAMRTADLEQSRHDAERANQAKSAFLATVSHEIRTPMNGVIGMTELLQQSNLNRTQTEMVRVIHDSAFSLLGVINDILDFSKIEAGKLQVENEAMSVAGAVEEVCRTLDALAVRRGVELTLFTDPAIPALLLGDAGRLRQILINLTNNAIKFSGGMPHQGKVSVRSLLVADDGKQVTLEFRVLDNGIGIDEATQEKLFTPFTQADAGATRDLGGTGLGLAISRQLAGMMGGRITLQSAPGEGALFSVHLPFTRLQGHPDVPEAPSRLAGLSCLVLGEGLTEDLVVYLKRASALVERARSLAAARAWIEHHPPGLCVIVIDAAGAPPPVDELRSASQHRPNLALHFVVIKHNRHYGEKRVTPDLVELDAEVMNRQAFLDAVAQAAGFALQDVVEMSQEDEITVPLLSREEARRQHSLVLVAEDNDINRKVIARQLMSLGYTADIADNGREALKLWQSGDYNLLLADLQMPEMNGYELTAAIRTSENGHGRIPIIAFTANVIKGEEDHCRAVGMDDYLTKPVQLLSLRAILEKWLPGAASKGREIAVTTMPASSYPMHLDVSVLKRLVGDDAALIRRFLTDFHGSAVRIAAALRNACAAANAAEVGAIAHKLKSSARSVGAMPLGDLCAAIEQAGKAGDVQALAELLPKFEQEFASVKQRIENY